MNILLAGGLPEDYEGIPISADFRNMIQVDLILKDPAISDAEKTALALCQLYPEIPGDIRKAIEGLVWFYTRGGEAAEGGQGRTEKRSYDFEQDANLIYAAFYAAYGISLTTVDFLHWWEFMALLECLGEDTLFKRVVYYRTADTSSMSASERQHVRKMRALFALKYYERAPLSMEEIDARTRERVARRFAEAEKALENK